MSVSKNTEILSKTLPAFFLALLMASHFHLLCLGPSCEESRGVWAYPEKSQGWDDGLLERGPGRLGTR